MERSSVPTDVGGGWAPEPVWTLWGRKKTFTPAVKQKTIPVSPLYGHFPQCAMQPLLTSALERGWMVNATPRPLYPQEGAPEPVWKGMKKRISRACTGVRTPDQSSRSDSLYHLHCPHSSSTLTTQIFAPSLQHDALHRRHIHILQATLQNRHIYR